MTSTMLIFLCKGHLKEAQHLENKAVEQLPVSQTSNGNTAVKTGTWRNWELKTFTESFLSASEKYKEQSCQLLM